MHRHMHRGKKAALNTLMSVLAELTAVVCGFILPRLVLKTFGSQYNGLTTSISQFLSMAVLMRAGIGGATRAALYKPLARKDRDEVNAIMKATDLFMKRIGLILGGSILAFAAVYGFITIREFDWIFTFSLFLIIGMSTFVENFAGITYLILLQADQRLYVSSLITIIATILNTIVSAVMINLGFGIHLVKLGSAAVFVAKPIVMQIYVRKHYKLDLNVEPDKKAINQRWDAFWHQVANFVMNNTDVMVLTIFTNMREVSVYSIYHMVTHNIYRITNSLTSGLEAAFGNMIAKEEHKTLGETFSVIEWLIYSLSTLICSVAALLIFEFVRLYTKGVTDVDYIRPLFAYLVIGAQFLSCVRMPSLLVVQAAGKYKETRNGAILEPIINIVLSVVFVFNFGMVGVAVGTLAATVFRSVQYSVFASRHILKRSVWVFPGKILLALAETAVIFVIWRALNLAAPSNYFKWAIHGVIASGIAGAVILAFSAVFFLKDMKNCRKKLRNLRSGKGKKPAPNAG